MYNFKLKYIAVTISPYQPKTLTQQTSDKHQPSHASLAHLSIPLAAQSI